MGLPTRFKDLNIDSGGRIQSTTGLFTSLVPSGCAFTFEAIFPSFTGNVLCLSNNGTEVAYVSGTGDGYFAGGLSIFGPLNMNGNQINNLAEPTSPQDAATKHYVDTRPNSSQSVARFLANGFYRVDTNVDGVYVCPRNGIITTIYLHREIAGSSGTTTISVYQNNSSIGSLSVNASSGNDAQSSSSTSINVSNGDILTISIDSVEAGDPENVTVEVIIN